METTPLAFGSLNEAFSQFDLAQSLNYISDEQLKSIERQYITVASLLSGLRRSIQSRYENSFNIKP